MLKRTLVALAAAVFSLCAYATDYTDMWWNPNEDGWGVNLTQNGQVIFGTFFVYGPGNAPTWYVGIMWFDGAGAYTGDLFSTTGTYFGTVPYDKNQFTHTKVGTATFRPSAADRGTLTYNVGAVPVVKSIERQTLTSISLAGNYNGAISVMDSNCTNPIDNGPVNIPASIAVSQPAAGPLRIDFTVPSFGTCAVVSSGAVTQSGALFSFAATLSCPGDTPYALTVSEMKATSLGIEGRWSAPRNVDGCVEEGRFGGVRAF